MLYSLKAPLPYGMRIEEGRQSISLHKLQITVERLQRELYMSTASRFCVEVLQPSQPNWVMSSAVSFT